MELPAALQRVRKVQIAPAGWLGDYNKANKAFAAYEEENQVFAAKLAGANKTSRCQTVLKYIGARASKKPEKQSLFEEHFDAEERRLLQIASRVSRQRDPPKNASKNPLAPVPIVNKAAINVLDISEDWRLRPLRQTDVVLNTLKPPVLAAIKAAFDEADNSGRGRINSQQFYSFVEKYGFETNRGTSDRLFALWDSPNIGLLDFENFAMAIGPKWTALQYDWKSTGGMVGDQPRKVGGVPKPESDRLDAEGAE
jgi:hypothetical protein